MRRCQAGVAPRSAKILFASPTNIDCRHEGIRGFLEGRVGNPLSRRHSIAAERMYALLVVRIAVILGTPVGFRNTPAGACDS